MANRHTVQKKAKGGGVAPKMEGKREMYTGKGSNVEKEAEEKKRGGKVVAKATGGAAPARLDKKARGGSVKASKIHNGADMKTSPWSAAHTGHGKNPAENPKAHLPHGEK